MDGVAPLYLLPFPIGMGVILLNDWAESAAPRRTALLEVDGDELLGGPAALLGVVERELAPVGFARAGCFRDLTRGGHHAVLLHSGTGLAVLASTGPRGASLEVGGSEAARPLFRVESGDGRPTAGPPLVGAVEARLRAELGTAAPVAAAPFDAREWLERRLLGRVDDAVARGELVARGDFVRPTLLSALTAVPRALVAGLRSLAPGGRTDGAAVDPFLGGLSFASAPARPAPDAGPAFPDRAAYLQRLEAFGDAGFVRGAWMAVMVAPVAIPLAVGWTMGGVAGFCGWVAYGLWLLLAGSRGRYDLMLEHGLACPACAARLRNLGRRPEVACARCGAPLVPPPPEPTEAPAPTGGDGSIKPLPFPSR